MSRIEAIRQRAAQATKGPWSYERCEDERGGIDYDIESWSKPARRRDTKIACGCESRFDAEFIAHAREDVPYLLTLWDTRETALRALVERMTHQAVQLHPNDPVRVALKPHIESLSRLLEQEP